MLVNLSVEEFKAQANASTVQIVRNPKTSKLFASAAGKNYRVQGDIDVTKTVTFMYEDDATKENPGVENGCFVNSNEDNLIASL